MIGNIHHAIFFAKTIRSSLSLSNTRARSVKDFYVAPGRVVDKYCVKTDRNGGIVNYHNHTDEP